MSPLRTIYAVILCCGGGLLAACGYQFAGAGAFPGGVQRIYIPTFENQTSETAVENQFTNDLIYEFSRNGRQIAQNKADGDATLNGLIYKFAVESIARRGNQTATERRVRVWMNVTLEASDGKVLWVRKGLTENEAYDVVGDKQSTDQNKREAIDKLSVRMAEHMFRILTADF